MRYIVLDKNSSDFHLYKEQIYSLRHKVFKEKLNWNVLSVNGQEIDYFDSLPQLFYIIVVNDNNELLGCIRFLPTMNDYMIANVFPQLLDTYPRVHNIWEISRFAIDPSLEKNNNLLCLNLPTLLLLQGMCEFARKQGIDQFVAATTITLNRLVRKIHMDTEVIGNTLQIDNTKVIALAIYMNQQTFNGISDRLEQELTTEHELCEVV